MWAHRSGVMVFPGVEDRQCLWLSSLILPGECHDISPQMFVCMRRATGSIEHSFTLTSACFDRPGHQVIVTLLNAWPLKEKVTLFQLSENLMRVHWKHLLQNTTLLCVAYKNFFGKRSVALGQTTQWFCYSILSKLSIVAPPTKVVPNVLRMSKINRLWATYRRDIFVSFLRFSKI